MNDIHFRVPYFFCGQILMELTSFCYNQIKVIFFRLRHTQSISQSLFRTGTEKVIQCSGCTDWFKHLFDWAVEQMDGSESKGLQEGRWGATETKQLIWANLTAVHSVVTHYSHSISTASLLWRRYDSVNPSSLCSRGQGGFTTKADFPLQSLYPNPILI